MTESRAVTTPVHTIVHTELASEDVDATRAFFTRAFGWSFEDLTEPGQPKYAFVKDGRGQPVGGLRTVEDNEPGPGVTNYISVADADEAARTVTEAGGLVLVPPQDVGDMGRMLLFQCPGGTIFGCWQDKRL